tara:strand:+ start:944 stop:1471 length:528 start_codon:yes stop_codon:yes gene_type:complete
MMMMINPEVITGNFGAPAPKRYTGDDDVVTSKIDAALDIERGWSGWTGDNTEGTIEQTPLLASLSVIRTFIERVPELAVKFGSFEDDGVNGTTMSLRTSENAMLQDNDILVAQYTAEMSTLIQALQEALKNAGLTVRFEELGVQVTPGMYRSAGQGQSMRQSVFTIQGDYKLFFS